MNFGTAEVPKATPSKIVVGDSHRLADALEQFHVVAQKALALAEINSAFMRYVDSAPDVSPPTSVSMPRYAELGAMICQNTQLWMSLVYDLRKTDHSFGAKVKVRLRGLAKLAAAYGQRVLIGKATPQLLIDINLGGIANPREALSDLTQWNFADVPEI